jgi:hypothetical protein
VIQTTAPLALTARAIPGRVGAGDKVTVIAQGQPHANMSIEVNDLSFTQLFNLLPKLADDAGQATWRFQLSKNYRANLLPIIVTEKQGADVRKVIISVPAEQQAGSVEHALPLSFVEFPKDAAAGARVQVTVKTSPGARARIEAQGAGFPQASSLLDRTTDQQGLATWTWELPTDYATNIMPIVVTSDEKDRESKIIGAIHVLPRPLQPPVPQKENNLSTGKSS